MTQYGALKGIIILNRRPGCNSDERSNPIFRRGSKGESNHQKYLVLIERLSLKTDSGKQDAIFVGINKKEKENKVKKSSCSQKPSNWKWNKHMPERQTSWH